MQKCKCHAPKLYRHRLALSLNWKYLAVCAVAMALSAIPFYAQQRGSPGIGPGPRSDCHPNWGASCGVLGAVIGDMPPLTKTEIADDQKCLPWNLPSARDVTSSVTTL